MNIDFYTKNLIQESGIWYNNAKSTFSYPHEGNDISFQLENNSFWFNYRNKFILAAIKNYPPDGAFFDVGGGNGFVAKEIQDAGIEVVLVEPGENGCINAKKRNIHHVICSTLENAGFEKNTIPNIGLFDVLEHFENDIAFLEKIHSYLMKDGLLYITVPAYNMIWSAEDDHVGHFNRYTLKSLAEKLNSIGFKIPYSTYFFSILPIPIFLLRTIPGKLGLQGDSGNMKSSYQEHKDRGMLLNKLWIWELNKIKHNKTIPFGGSCLMIARKK